MARILFVLTSHAHLLDGTPTGVWLEEHAVPYGIFTEAGHEVVVTSVAGGDVPIDPKSAPDAEHSGRWAEAIAALKNTQVFDRVDPAGFDAVYIPGGHGTVFDMPYNRRLHALLADFEASGRVVAAVCHAPAVFAGMRRSDGSPWIAGRRVAAFTDSEERAAGGTQTVPFLLETRLKELGALHQGVADWQPLAVADGRLVTGQNPASSAAVAQQVTALLRQSRQE